MSEVDALPRVQTERIAKLPCLACCRQIRGLQQQAQLDQQTASEAAAAAAKLQQANEKLTQQLQDQTRQHKAAQQEGDARLHLHQSEVPIQPNLVCPA